MTISVRPAFFACGGLKAGTPLLMASMPVRAVLPVEKGVQDQEQRHRLDGGGAPSAKGWAVNEQTDHPNSPASWMYAQEENIDRHRHQGAGFLEAAQVDQGDDQQQDQRDHHR